MDFIANLISKVKGFFGGNEAPVPEADPVDLPHYVRAAYALLADANKRAIQIPADVVDVITQARRAQGQLPDGLEARFWNAYGLLSSSIQPAAKARNLYRNIFYIVLLALLFAQFFFLAGDYVRTKLADIDKQIVDIRGRAAAPSNPAAPGSAITAPVDPVQKIRADEQIDQVLQTRKAYLFLSANLLDIVGTIADLPLRPFGFHSFFSDNVVDRDGVIVRGKLDMLLVFLSGYLLPMLYGLLGACAFVLRKLSDEIDKLTFANDARVRYSLRLNIGLLAGLAVGWFIKPGNGDATLVSLSPLALAFVAGYGSDLFFVALDKIVQAFAPAPASSSTIVKESTAGGIATTTFEGKAATVAGRQNGNADGEQQLKKDEKDAPIDPPDRKGSIEPTVDVPARPLAANRA
jgi:hypothetical protein